MNEQQIQSIIRNLDLFYEVEICLFDSGKTVCTIKNIGVADGEQLYARKHFIRHTETVEDKRELSNWLSIVSPRVVKIVLHDTEFIKKEE
jgi:hypothetical protein